MPDKYIRWTHAEWLKVAVNMLPRLDRGESNLVALANAMRKVVAKNRWQSDQFIAHTCQPKRAQGLLKSWLDKARALPEAERNALLVLTPAQRFALENPDAPKPEPKPRKSQAKPDTERLIARAGSDKGRVYKGGAKWTTREWALIARMVKWFQTHGVTLALSRLVIEAQELVLDADRRRSLPGIQASIGNGRLERAIAVGMQNAYLVTDVPFNPPHPPGSEPAEEAAQAPETAQIEAISPQSVQTQPEAPTRPLAAGTLREDMSAAAQAFGNTVMQALDTLLGHHTQLVLSSMEARLAESSARMAAEVASMVQNGMRRAVADMLAHELGGAVSEAPQPGGITAPAPPIPPKHHNPVPPSANRPEQLKVDVVGFEIGEQQTTVEKAFAGEVDLRFIHPDKINVFAPHRGRHVVMMVGRVPHSLGDKFRAAKVEPIYVKRTPGHVIHAIEELQRARGMQSAH
jgi:hypothetical protein